MDKGNQEGKVKELASRTFLVVLAAVSALIMIILVLSYIVDDKPKERQKTPKTDQPEIEEMFLSPNQYSRSQKSLNSVKGIVIHYTANPGSTAKQNREYFENLKSAKTTYASSHFIVGLDGEIVQCVPLDEIAYASNERNKDTISIECCHPDKSGKFNKKTYASLVQLVGWLCGEFDLKKEDIIRHYDVTGKMCPKYYVKHDNAWNKFKDDVFDYVEKKKAKEAISKE